MAWDTNLTGTALTIAQSGESPLCVFAGPGTGKSYALKRRVARLLEVENVEPSRILACTFTRTAAEDLRREIAGLGVAGADRIKAQTIHSLCFSILSREDVLQTTGRVPRPLLDFEQRFLLQDLCQAGRGGLRECGKRVAAFEAAWARLQHEEPGWPLGEADRAFQRALHGWLRFHHAMLIGEVIPETLKYLRDNPLSAHRQAFDHVLVDEYQDLNRAEQALIELLAPGSLVVIGDADQAIYTFKHAHPEGIADFPRHHPTAIVFGLDECRRCPLLVVEMANALVAHNLNRPDRRLLPQPAKPPGEVFVVQWPSPEAEARGVARFIADRVGGGRVDPGKVLVLSPRRGFAYSIRDELKRQQVNAHSFFAEELLDGDPKDEDSCAAQEALCLLTLLADPGDRVALRCWCGFGSDSLNAGPWARLRDYCERNGLAPRAALEQIIGDEAPLPHVKPLTERFFLLEVKRKSMEGLRGLDLLSAIFPEEKEWARPFAAMAASLGADDYDAAALRDVIVRGIVQPEMPTDVDYVRLMSLHKSKGLTANLVVVVGCLEGLLPSVNYDGDDAEQARSLEEQRRLFYVAITRTTDTLVLSSVANLPFKSVKRMGARSPASTSAVTARKTSRFISELGPACPRAISGEQFLKDTVSAH